MPRRGDFRVSRGAAEYAGDVNEERSERARDVDEQRRAPVTTDIDRWRDNKDDLDYPGVDTPSDDPKVLPKDLKQSEKPATTGRASGEMPADVEGGEPYEWRDRDSPLERIELANRDVSLAPDEAFRGVGATSSREIGGFQPGHGESAPVSEPDPPEGLFEIGFDFGHDEYTDDQRDDITAVYEDFSGELPDEVGLQEFAQRTRRRQRKLGGLPDDEGAAIAVVNDLGFGGGR